MTLAYETQPGDIDHLIADDHAIVERQFQYLESGAGDRRVLVDQISFELSLHAFAEETVLYPEWDEVGMSEEREHALAEHRKLKELLVALAKHEPGENEFESALSELIAQTRHHVKDEEGNELPRFRRMVGASRSSLWIVRIATP